MIVRQVGPRWAALALIGLILAACGASAPPASNAAASGGAPDPSAPVIDVANLAGSMAAAEVAMRLEDRERSGLGDLGPGAPELAAAMDASAGRALDQTRTDASAAGGSLQGHLAGVGPLVAAPVGPLAAPEPGFNAMVVWAVLITSLDGFAKGQGENGTVQDKPETIEIAGNTGTITTSITLKAVTSGSKLSVDITMKTKGQVVDKATGAILYGIDSIASGHADLDFCPDAGGKAAANVELTSSEIYTKGGGSAKGISKVFSGAVSISVDDEANISKVEGASKGAEESKGGVAPAGGGESTVEASTRTAGGDIANDGAGSRLPGVPRDIKFGGEGSTLSEQGMFWGSMTVFVETMVTAAAKEAEKLWREGKCVELLVDPEGGDISPDETRSVTAKLKHKIDGKELDKPVVAKLTGVQLLDPDGTKQPAPATVTYTAGPNQGDVGRIEFRSVSNRGIAEKTVTFTVGGESLKVSLSGTMSTTLAGITYTTTVSAPSIALTRQADGTYSGSGTSTASVKIPIGDCPNPYNQTGTMKLVATREVVTDPAQPRDWIITWDPTGVYTTTGYCTIQGQRIDMEAFTGQGGPTGGFMFILGDIVADPDGGTQKLSFTKALGPSSNKMDATATVEIVKGATP